MPITTNIVSSNPAQVIDDLTDFRYLVKDILSSGQSVIDDLTDFRYLVKDIYVIRSVSDRRLDRR